MSNYKPESEFSVINREAASHPVVVEPGLFHLLEICVRRSQQTGGAFDITVGPLMKAWGFFRGRGRLPSRAKSAKSSSAVGYQHLKLDAERRTIKFDESGVEIDLGGIAKGYAVDRAVEVLRSNGITSALVSSGTSSIYALGSPPGEHGWKITVRDPYDAHKAGDVFHLQNYSLSTSGSYEHFFKIEGKNYCHIMNPHTGWPVEDMLSTVVLAATGTDTDGRSAGCFVMGVERTRKYLALTRILPSSSTSRAELRRTTNASCFAPIPTIFLPGASWISVPRPDVAPSGTQENSCWMPFSHGCSRARRRAATKSATGHRSTWPVYDSPRASWPSPAPLRKRRT